MTFAQITPGVLTDAFGLLLLIPPIRRALADHILRNATGRVGGRAWAGGHQGGYAEDAERRRGRREDRRCVMKFRKIDARMMRMYDEQRTLLRAQLDKFDNDALAEYLHETYTDAISDDIDGDKVMDRLRAHAALIGIMSVLYESMNGGGV